MRASRPRRSSRPFFTVRQVIPTIADARVSRGKRATFSVFGSTPSGSTPPTAPSPRGQYTIGCDPGSRYTSEQSTRERVRGKPEVVRTTRRVPTSLGRAQSSVSVHGRSSLSVTPYLRFGARHGRSSSELRPDVYTESYVNRSADRRVPRRSSRTSCSCTRTPSPARLAGPAVRGSSGRA